MPGKVPFGQFGSVGATTHHWHAGSFGPVVVGLFGSTGLLHAAVPRGSWPLMLKGLERLRVIQPCPPSHIGSLHESSSSVTTITATIESGRKKLRRCCKTV